MSAGFGDDFAVSVPQSVCGSVGVPTSCESRLRTDTRSTGCHVAETESSVAGALPKLESGDEAYIKTENPSLPTELGDFPAAPLVDGNPLPLQPSSAALRSASFSVPHGSTVFPIPPFLVRLWILDWERQERFTQATGPLPLHNPSSYCFFSSSLQALASLQSVLDLAHNLAFLRLLEKNLALDGVVRQRAQLLACPPQAGTACGGAFCATGSDGMTAGPLRTSAARQLTPPGTEVTTECFPLSLYRCLLALNRGRVRGSFCRTPSSYAACACTGVEQWVPPESERDCGAEALAAKNFQIYGGSLLDLLRELAAITTVPKARYTRRKKLDQDAAAEAGVATANCWAALETAVASSVRELEDEWRRVIAVHADALTVQQSSALAMYTDLMKTIQLSAETSGCHSAFGTLLEGASLPRDRHIGQQDTHELLHLLIEEMEKECDTAGKLQEALKAYLDRLLTLSKSHCVGDTDQSAQPGPTSHANASTSRKSIRCAVTAPTEGVLAPSPASAEGADSRVSHSVGGGSPGSAMLPSEFISCNGLLWNLIPQTHLKSIFVGLLRESVRCLRCGICSPERSNPFWCIHVTLTDDGETTEVSTSKSTNPTLEKLINVALGPQSLEDVECTSCSVFATIAYLRDRLSASPLLASLRFSPGVRQSHSVAADPHRTYEAFSHTEETLRDPRSIRASEAHAGTHPGHQKPSASPGLGSRGYDRGGQGLRSIVRSDATGQGRPAGVTSQNLTAGDCDVDEQPGAETLCTLLDDAPGLFSPFWHLPASIVSEWVRIWGVLFRFRRYLETRESTEHSAGHQQKTLVPGRQQAVGGMSPACGDRAELKHKSQNDNRARTASGPQAMQSAGAEGLASSDGSQLIPETDEGLRRAAGEFWTPKRGPKEKRQRVERLPSVLIIQVNALKLTSGGRLDKVRKHCMFPFLLDASFITRGMRGGLHEKPSSLRDGCLAAPGLCAADDEPSDSPCGEESEREDIRRSLDKSSSPSLAGPAASGTSQGSKGAPRTVAATAEGDACGDCWCGLHNLYELRAVITHAGTSASAGHFACYRRWDARAFIPGAASYVFFRQFLSGFARGPQNGSHYDTAKTAAADPNAHTAKQHRENHLQKAGWHRLRLRVRQWLLHAAREGCRRSAFVWISDDCVRPATLTEVQAAQPYLLFYEKVFPSVF